MTLRGCCPMFDQLNELPVVSLNMKQAEMRDVGVHLLRLDQINQRVSGNKWFKLKYNLEKAKVQGGKAVLSFGGAYSNHIHALAWAGQVLGIKTIGIIRGESDYASNPTLTDAARWGMELHFVTRAEYKQRKDADFLQGLRDRFGDPFIVPEGGSNALAVKGTAEIVNQSLIQKYGIDNIVLACGTGGTLAGVAASQPSVNIVGIPVLKGAKFLKDDISMLLESAGYSDVNNWVLDYNGHFGGYAKTSPELLAFISMMDDDYDLPLDQIYTGKMMLRLIELIEEGFFTEGSQILALHTGGLQGLRSL